MERVGGNVLPIYFPIKELNANFLQVWMIIQSYFQGWGVTQVAAYNRGDFLNEETLYMVVLWFGYIWSTFSQNCLTGGDPFLEALVGGGFGRFSISSKLIHWHFRF